MLSNLSLSPDRLVAGLLLLAGLCISTDLFSQNATQPDGVLEIRYGTLIDTSTNKVICFTNSVAEETWWGESNVLAGTPLGQEWRLFSLDGDFLGAIPYSEIPRATTWRWDGDALMQLTGTGEVPVAIKRFTNSTVLEAAGDISVAGATRIFSAADLQIDFNPGSLVVRQWSTQTILASWLHPIETSGLAYDFMELKEDGSLFFSRNNTIWNLDSLRGVVTRVGFLGLGGAYERAPKNRIVSLGRDYLVLLDETGRALDSMDRLDDYIIRLPDPDNVFAGFGQDVFKVISDVDKFVTISKEGTLSMIDRPEIMDLLPPGAGHIAPEWWHYDFPQGDTREHRFYHYNSSEAVAVFLDPGNRLKITRQGRLTHAILEENRVVLDPNNPFESVASAGGWANIDSDFTTVTILPAQPVGLSGYRALAELDPRTTGGESWTIPITFSSDYSSFSSGNGRETSLPEFDGYGYWARYGLLPSLGGNWYIHPNLNQVYITPPMDDRAWVYSETAGWLYLEANVFTVWAWSANLKAWINPHFAQDSESWCYFDAKWQAWDALTAGIAPAFYARRNFLISMDGAPIERWSLDNGTYSRFWIYGEAPYWQDAIYSMQAVSADEAVLNFLIPMGDAEVRGEYQFNFTTSSSGTVESSVEALVNGQVVDSSRDSGNFQMRLPGEPWP